MKYEEYMLPEANYIMRAAVTVIVALYLIWVCSIPAKLLIMWLDWLF